MSMPNPRQRGKESDVTEVTQTRRLKRNIAHRPTAFVPIGSGAGEVIAGLGREVRVVYLVGARPRDWLAWAGEALPAGVAPGAHYLDGTAPVLRYSTPDGPLELHPASTWYGAGPYSPADATAAYELLREILGRAFEGSTVLATPATTGRELFLRSIPFGAEYPVLDLETQRLIRATDGQGRVEIVRAARGELELPALEEYDARFAYAALCWELPVGPAVHDTEPTFAGHTRGRYRVAGRVPADWTQPFGLIGVKAERGLWSYPHEPGAELETWCDGAELHLATKHGWELEIRERLLFPNVAKPLDLWADKLTRARRALELDREAGRDPAVLELTEHALRAVLLHGIGAFHGREHLATRMVPLADAHLVPATAIRPRRAGRRHEWIVYGETTGQRWPQLAHPEWSACVWGRARARLLHAPRGHGALNRAPGTEVVAFRTDAIYLTGRQPAWEHTDNGRAGSYRRKRTLPPTELGADWPRSNRELLELRTRMRAT